MYYSPWSIVKFCYNPAQGLDFSPQTCHTTYMKNETTLMTETLDIQKVTNLLPRNVCYINWHEEGGGEVHRSADRLFLYCIPQYGGEGHLVGEFDFNEEGIKALVKEANSWT